MNEESKLIELFKKYPGIAARIRRSFAYHYDQIQREIEAEVATINKDDAATIIDYTTEYMEESMGWPDADDQTTFNNQIAKQLTLTNKTYNIMTTLNSNLKQYGNTTANIHCIYTHHRQPRTNMITSLIAGQEMTNTNISMTTTRTNTQNIITN